ncbi:MAG TPA: glycosyltransferase family 1 protein [Gemmataceae bacterium]|nr:glycosyltransferase family 1 protein [Gemmataceae bacterium]
MKIGFDVSQTGALRAGCGYFADSLIRALAAGATPHQFVLYPTFGNFFLDPNWESNTYAPEQPNFSRGLAHTEFDQQYAFWTTPPADFEEQIGGPDLVHANNFFCPKQLEHARLVYTLYDLSFLENPQWTQEANRTGCFEGVFQASLHADHILAISHFTKRHFLEIFPHYPQDRITVAHLASRFTDVAQAAQPEPCKQLQPDKFWLCVGTLEPRKNHARLLQAFAKLKAQSGGRTLPLVLAGGRGWLTDDLHRLIALLGLADDVVLPGYVDDQTLQWLYENCFAVLYPSLFEGFGLPVLEAMSLGAAVITSNTTSIPEIAGDAALLVNPLREEEILDAMLRLLAQPELRGKLRQQAQVQARRFCWADAARTTLECYEQTLLSPRLKDTLVKPFVSERSPAACLLEKTA